MTSWRDEFDESIYDTFGRAAKKAAAAGVDEAKVHSALLGALNEGLTTGGHTLAAQLEKSAPKMLRGAFCNQWADALAGPSVP